jgi:Protein of unknown function (DUF2752)
VKRALGAALLFAVLYVAAPPPHPTWTLCGFHRLTGHECPLCGLTRGICALAKGQVRQALDFNALTPLAFTMLFALFWRHPLTGRLWSFGIAAFSVYGACRYFG